MTALLGYADGTNVWIGGDSASQNGGDARVTVMRRKVFRCGDMLIGVAGLARVSQVLRADFMPPSQPEGQSDESYMVTLVVSALQKCLEQHECALRDKDGNWAAMLVGYKGVLYSINSDYSLSAYRTQMYNLGSGGEMAFGAFIVAHRNGLSVEEAMLTGLVISAQHCISVDIPCYVEKI